MTKTSPKSVIEMRSTTGPWYKSYVPGLTVLFSVYYENGLLLLFHLKRQVRPLPNDPFLSTFWSHILRKIKKTTSENLTINGVNNRQCLCVTVKCSITLPGGIACMRP